MTLFHDDGHLSGEGLKALLNEQLDEMGRLEAAEHLSFCDECLMRYTTMLDGQSLMEPQTPVQPRVMQRLKRRKGKVSWARYGTVAAAACLAVMVWGVSSFALPRLGQRATQPDASSAAQQAGTAGDGQGGGIGDVLNGAMDSVTDFLNNLGSGAGRTQNAADPVLAEQQREEEARREKEKVFERDRDADKRTGQEDTQDDTGTKAPDDSILPAA